MKHHRVSRYINNQYKPETNHNESSHIIPNTTKLTQGSRDQSEKQQPIHIHIKNRERVKQWSNFNIRKKVRNHQKSRGPQQITNTSNKHNSTLTLIEHNKNNIQHILIVQKQYRPLCDSLMKPLTYASHVLSREKHSRRIQVFEYKPCLKPRTSLRGRISSTKAMIYFQRHSCTLRTGGMQHPRVFLAMNQVMGNS